MGVAPPRRSPLRTGTTLRRLLLLAALVAGPLLYLRRRAGARTERVRLHFDDGSMVTLEDGAPGSERLVALARRAL